MNKQQEKIKVQEAIKILTSEIYSDDIAECGVKFEEALDTVIKALERINIPEDATNGQVFIYVFGIDAWKQMIEFSKVNDQFREFWNAPYKAESGENEND